MALNNGKWVDADLQYQMKLLEFFFAKVAPVQSITDIALLDFWLMLLPWMFVLSYFTIYFFVKILLSVNTIFRCFFRENCHSLSTYATGGDVGGSFKMLAAAYRGKRMSCLMLPHVLTAFFHVFGSILVLSCLVSFTEI